MKLIFLILVLATVLFAYPVQSHEEFMRPFGTDIIEFEKNGQIHKIRIGRYVKQDHIIVYDNKCKQDQTLIPYGEQYKLQLCNGIYVSYISDYYINKEYTPMVKFFLEDQYKSMNYRGKLFLKHSYKKEELKTISSIIYKKGRYYLVKDNKEVMLK